MRIFRGTRALKTRVSTTSLWPKLMHPRYLYAAQLTERIIGAAIEVHRDKGPGLVESIYEWCLMCELQLRGIAAANQQTVRVGYKRFIRDEPFRLDVLVEGCVLVEAKAVSQILPIHKAQLISYMKLADVPIGLLINFNVMKLSDGVSRVMLPGANRSDLQEATERAESRK